MKFFESVFEKKLCQSPAIVRRKMNIDWVTSIRETSTDHGCSYRNTGASTNIFGSY